jgi:hypothetical protein
MGRAVNPASAGLMLKIRCGLAIHGPTPSGAPDLSNFRGPLPCESITRTRMSAFLKFTIHME